MRKICLILLIGISTVSDLSAQSEIDTNELNSFIHNIITPLSNKEVPRILEFTHFPLEGDWGFMIGLKRKEFQWTKDDLIQGLDSLINDNISTCLKQLTLDEIAIVNIEDYGRQLAVYCNWKNGDFEKGIIFKFTEIDGEWKLLVIQNVG